MPEQKTEYDVVGAIIEYESGQLDDEAALKLFQHLVDNNMLGGMQGHYGRAAEQLIKAGKIHARK